MVITAHRWDKEAPRRLQVGTIETQLGSKCKFSASMSSVRVRVFMMYLHLLNCSNTHWKDRSCAIAPGTNWEGTSPLVVIGEHQWQNTANSHLCVVSASTEVILSLQLALSSSVPWWVIYLVDQCLLLKIHKQSSPAIVHYVFLV